MMSNLHTHLILRLWPIGVLLLALPLLSGCGYFAPRASSLQAEPVLEVTLVEATESTSAPTAQPVSDEAPIFVWQGALEDGSCGQVMVTEQGAGGVGPCNNTTQMSAWLPIHETEWGQIQAHFGELSYVWGDETLTLHGAGAVEDNVWAEAMGVWARFVYQEAQAGRSSSAGRTALAWQLPQAQDADDALCGRLLVLRYGYAYALVEPCEGGANAEPLDEGWLTTEEMSQFTTWLRDWAPVYSDAGYLDGQGDAEVDAEQTAALEAWVAAVYARMTAQ